jgi:hypothetical protein
MLYFMQLTTAPCHFLSLFLTSKYSPLQPILVLHFVCIVLSSERGRGIICSHASSPQNFIRSIVSPPCFSVSLRASTLAKPPSKN